MSDSTYTEAMSGGLIGGGTSVPSSLNNLSVGLSGCFLSGNADAFSVFNANADSLGGVQGNDLLEISVQYNIDFSGGTLAGGDIDIQSLYEHIPSGGIFAGGQSLSDSSYIPSGGILAGGDKDIQSLYDHIPSGGIASSGDSEVSFNYTIENLGGGSLLGGESFSQIVVLMLGGVAVSGLHELDLGFSPMGGVQTSGTSEVTSFVNEPVDGIATGGIAVAGSSQDVYKRVWAYIASGQVAMSGNYAGGMTSAHVSASGSISVSSDFTKVNFKFYHDLSFNWRLNSGLVRDIDFSWNVGQLSSYWYRVVSKGQKSSCLPQDPCCQKFILNVHARSLSELCQKLSQRRFKFPIDFVQRFSRPAENTVVAAEEAAGINHDCNNLIDVEVCNIPECADFCVQEDLLFQIGFNMKVQINAFESYEAEGSAFISGAAQAVCTKVIPEFPFVSSGSLVTTGSAEAYPNHFKMLGGTKIGGNAHSQSSRWSFVAGEWPNITPITFGVKTASVLKNVGEQNWSLTERICANDGLYSSTDISYGKTSQLLTVTGFSFNLPEWAKILKVDVRVDRLASNIGVRDKEVYLIRNDQIISDNLAVTNIDWPLFETEKIYGSDGWRNFSLEDFDQDLNKSDLDDPTFGVAIKVRSVSSNLTAIARIDYVNVEVYYEDETGSKLRVSSQGSVYKSPSYHLEASGKVSLGGSSGIVSTKKYRENVKNFGLRSGGGACFQYTETPSGGASLGSEALVLPYLEVPTGGLTIGFIEAPIQPEWHTMTGGLLFSGEASIVNLNRPTPQGGLIASGLFIVITDQFFYSSKGSLGTGGTSTCLVSHRSFASEGGNVLVEGKALTKAGSISIDYEQLGFNMSVSDLTAAFLADVELNDLTGLTETLQKCNCYQLPLIMNFSQNFTTNNNFSKFLVRNGFAVSNNLQMHYNVPNDSWQTNLHFKGLSADNNTYESWDFSGELNCSNVVGGIVIGRPVWLLSLRFLRKKLSTGENFDTRIMAGVIPDGVCKTASSSLDFLLEYNTQSGVSTVTPNSTVYQFTVYDNIGLFKNPAWIESPVLELKVSQLGTIKDQVRIDLTKAVLL